MPYPFPGMNPYLENPEIWTEVHHWLITGIAESLVPQLRPKYRVAVEKRIYKTIDDQSLLVGIPDVTVVSSPPNSGNVAVALPPSQPLSIALPMPEKVRESYLEIREVGTGAVITTIEVLSPKNKRAGDGRTAYDNKRHRILGSLTHLVEIDLLRTGTPMTTLNAPASTHYRIMVSRSERRPHADLYAFNLSDPIPPFPLPLKLGDLEPLVNLQDILQDIYDRAGFDLAVDYSQPPAVPLTEVDMTWITPLLSESRLT
ncbi:MAG: DUF4058 family protein [Thermosynechococcaceae cyanobacterium]